MKRDEPEIPPPWQRALPFDSPGPIVAVLAVGLTAAAIIVALLWMSVPKP